MLYELNHVEKTLSGRRVLDIHQLRIRPGLIYSLTGPNGAGKTTLLKLLAFLEKPSSGVMHFRSARVHHSEGDLLGLRRQVVLVDQAPLLFTGSVGKNVEFGLRMRKIPSLERKRRVLAALEQVGMAGFIRAEAHKLSGGETKRVALARALAVRPQVLLCDEPTANVDSENQRIILDILAEINRVEKTSIIFSTHYLAQEQELAHHCLQLQHGRISESAAENVFRAELIGRDENRCSYSLAVGMQISLPSTAAPAEPVVNVIIDSRKIRIPGENDSDRGGSRITGRIVHVGEAGDMIRIDIEAGISLHVFLSHDTYRKRPFLLGDHLTVFIPDEAVHSISAGL